VSECLRVRVCGCVYRFLTSPTPFPLQPKPLHQLCQTFGKIKTGRYWNPWASLQRLMRDRAAAFCAMPPPLPPHLRRRRPRTSPIGVVRRTWSRQVRVHELATPQVTHTHTHTHTGTHAHMHSCTRAHIHTYTHARARAHTHTHTHTHMYFMHGVKNQGAADSCC